MNHKGREGTPRNPSFWKFFLLIKNLSSDLSFSFVFLRTLCGYFLASEEPYVFFPTHSATPLPNATSACRQVGKLSAIENWKSAISNYLSVAGPVSKPRRSL